MPHTDWPGYRYGEGFYTSEVHTPRRLPVRTFLPTGYEPKYAYPLLVFFHGHGGSEERVLRLAPKLSRRNYICISLRGLQHAGLRPDGKQTYTWGLDGPLDAQVEDYVFEAIAQTRRSYHVHSERIFLAGICEGASLAYRIGLSFPERVAGIISLNGALPRQGGPLLLKWKQARALKVMIGHGIANPMCPLSMARADYQLLWNAGLAVNLHTYRTTNRLHADMLRDINRWVMDAISEE